MPLQIPPAVGSSGQFIETFIVTSSQHRHAMVIGDPFSTAVLTVSSSGGVPVFLTNPLTVIPGGSVIALTTGPTVIANPSTAVTITNPTTAVSVIGTVPIVSASSGLVQISGNPTVLTASSGFLVRALSSGTVTLSSNPTVVLSSPTSLSSGTVTFSSAPTVNVSSGVFTLSSTPLVIVATSGGTIPVTLSTVFSLSSNPTVVSASSGVVQVLQSTGTAGGVTSTYFVLTTIKGIKTAAGRLFGYSAFTSVEVAAGALLIFYNMTSGNVVIGTSQSMVVQISGLNSSAIAPTVNPVNPEWFGPNGIDFNTAISVASAVTATGAVVSTATPVYCTIFYV